MPVEPAAQHVGAPFAGRVGLCGIVAETSSRLRCEQVGVDQHLHAPLLAPCQVLQRLVERVALALEHPAHRVLALVEGAQPQRDDGGAAERLVEDGLVRARHLFEPGEVVQVAA